MVISSLSGGDRVRRCLGRAEQPLQAFVTGSRRFESLSSQARYGDPPRPRWRKRKRKRKRRVYDKSKERRLGR